MDFKDFVRKSLEEDLTMDEIGKKFADAMTEVEKENAEQQKARSDEKTKFIEDVDARLLDICDPDDLTFNDVAAFAGYVAMRLNPDWDYDKINLYVEAFKNSFNLMIVFMNDDPVTKLLDRFKESHEIIANKEHKCNCSDCKKTAADSDVNLVNDFFRKLGL